MASIEVLNATQANVETPVEIQLSLSNPIYRGPEGKPGKDGIIGRNGKSAYEIAVENGFVGTEVEWLASLKGADGTIGHDGAPGQDGAQGPKGDTPVKGVDYFTEQDIQDIIAQINTPGAVSVYKVKAWIQTVNSSKVDLRTIEEEDKIVFETIFQELLNDNDKFIIVWLGSDQGIYPQGFSIPEQNVVPCICKLNHQWYGETMSLHPIQNVGIQAFMPFELHFNGDNNQLSTTSLNFYQYSPNTSFIVGPDPTSDSNTDVALSTILNNMNAAYATKAEVETAIRGAETGLLKRAIVQLLPTENIDDNTIYMVPKTGSTGDIYDEYLYVDNTWEHIGSTDVDLTGYATEQYVDSHQLSATGSIKIEDNKIKSIFPYYKLFGLMSRVATSQYSNILFEDTNYPTFPQTGWTLPQASTFEEMIVALKEYGIVECVSISQPDGPSYYGPTLAQINAALGTNYTNIWCVDNGGSTGARRQYTENTNTGIHTSCVLLATDGNYMIDFINDSFPNWFKVCIYNSIDAPYAGFANLSGEKLIDIFKSIDTNLTQRPTTEYLTNTDVQNIWDGN